VIELFHPPVQFFDFDAQAVAVAAAISVAVTVTARQESLHRFTRKV
jgi:hypothetical protein